jgi:hypothetical protein
MIDLRSSQVVVRSRQTMEPAFVLQFYGVPSLAFIEVPDRRGHRPPQTGGRLIQQALREHGLHPDDWIASIFECY